MCVTVCVCVCALHDIAAFFLVTTDIPPQLYCTAIVYRNVCGWVCDMAAVFHLNLAPPQLYCVGIVGMHVGESVTWLLSFIWLQVHVFAHHAFHSTGLHVMQYCCWCMVRRSSTYTSVTRTTYTYLSTLDLLYHICLYMARSQLEAGG